MWSYYADRHQGWQQPKVDQYHLLQLIGGKHVAEYIEHFAGPHRVEVFFDGLDAFKEFFGARDLRECWSKQN
jgi:hypothetical protein